MGIEKQKTDESNKALILVNAQIRISEFNALLKTGLGQCDAKNYRSSLNYLSGAYHKALDEASRKDLSVRIVGSLRTGERMMLDRVWPSPGEVTAAEWSRDGSCVVVARTDGTARVMDCQAGEPVSPVLRHPMSIRQAKFNPDETLLATGGDGARLTIREVASWKVLRRVERMTFPNGSRPEFRPEGIDQAESLPAADLPDGTKQFKVVVTSPEGRKSALPSSRAAAPFPYWLCPGKLVGQLRNVESHCSIGAPAQPHDCR